MLSQKAKYAIKALLVLARAQDDLVQARDISDSENIPKKFLDLFFLNCAGTH
jgi:DNA-binding IscR family transcriptional regulator